MKQLRNFRMSPRDIPDEVMQNPAFGEAMAKYGNMNEDALIEQLLKQIRAAKQAGTYHSAQTEGYVAMLSPHLSAAQREKLANIVRVINAESEM
ncbi:MAG: hypothetical protein FWD58_03390 [Firmicutes bacterium]|nr:hypothetical protein [Bacillota bacterium]